MAIHDPTRPQHHYPMDDLTYDVLAILHEKSKGLEAYERYMEDARRDPEVLDLLEQIRADDEDHIEELKETLLRLLGGDGGGEPGSGPEEPALPRTADTAGEGASDADDDDE